ncbi:MAG: 3'-5' exonuclease [Treponema sp.]|nr:3'-5' exonuclease [Treponema sp.]
MDTHFHNPENSLSYIAIDFETANYDKHSACQIGMVRFIDGIETDTFSALIKPPDTYFVPKFTREIHHIAYDDVKDAPPFSDVWQTMAVPFILKTPRVPLVAHNAGFDMAVVRACCEYYAVPTPALKYFCSLKLSRVLWTALESHRLTALGEHCAITYTAHDALEDARTCGAIVRIMAAEQQVDTVRKLLRTARQRLSSL